MINRYQSNVSADFFRHDYINFYASGHSLLCGAHITIEVSGAPRMHPVYFTVSCCRANNSFSQSIKMAANIGFNIEH